MQMAPTFIVLVSNAGGEGKTLTAQVIQALWQMNEIKVELLDGDAGNMAAKIADLTAKVVGWGVPAIRAADIIDAVSGCNVVFDLGANAMASHREIVELLPALQEGFANAGYRTVAFLPVSTNKIGAVKGIKQLEEKLHGFEKRFIKVNRDGSGSFEEGLDEARTLVVGHLQPGFQSYIRQPDTSLARSVAEPPAGFTIAASYVADWMRRFALQPEVRRILGELTAPLDRFHPTPPPEIAFVVNYLWEAADAELAENIRRTRIVRFLDREGWTPTGLMQACLHFGYGPLTAHGET